MSDENSSNRESQDKADHTAPAGFNLGTVIDTAKAVITNPIGFYKSMPTVGGYTEPVIFVVVMAAITGIITLLFSLLGLGMVGIGFGTAIGIGAIFFMLIFSVIGSFIGAAFLFVIWKLMGSDKNYEAAYRCLAYTFSIMPIVTVISFIPYIAGIIHTAWVAFLAYVASTEVHKLNASTSKLVFGILAALGIIYNVSSERTARNFLDTAENWNKISEELQQEYKEGSLGEAAKKLEDFEDMTPEEAGKQVGEFLKGLEEFSKGVQEGAAEDSN